MKFSMDNYSAMKSELESQKVEAEVTFNGEKLRQIEQDLLHLEEQKAQFEQLSSTEIPQHQQDQITELGGDLTVTNEVDQKINTVTQETVEKVAEVVKSQTVEGKEKAEQEMVAREEQKQEKEKLLQSLQLELQNKQKFISFYKKELTSNDVIIYARQQVKAMGEKLNNNLEPIRSEINTLNKQIDWDVHDSISKKIQDIQTNALRPMFIKVMPFKKELISLKGKYDFGFIKKVGNFPMSFPELFAYNQEMKNVISELCSTISSSSADSINDLVFFSANDRFNVDTINNTSSFGDCAELLSTAKKLKNFQNYFSDKNWDFLNSLNIKSINNISPKTVDDSEKVIETLKEIYKCFKPLYDIPGNQLISNRDDLLSKQGDIISHDERANIQTFKNLQLSEYREAQLVKDFEKQKYELLKPEEELKHKIRLLEDDSQKIQLEIANLKK